MSNTGGTAAMTPWVEMALAKYGTIVAGWVIGTAAKYGLTLGEGRKVTPRMILIDLLLMGFVVLLARWIIERLGLNAGDAATIAALIGLSSERIIRLVRQWFLKRADEYLEQHVKGEIRQAAQMEMSATRTMHDIATGKRPLGGE